MDIANATHADCSQCPMRIVCKVPCKMYMMARESQFKRYGFHPTLRFAPVGLAIRNIPNYALFPLCAV